MHYLRHIWHFQPHPTDSDDSPETDVEEELNALLKPKSPKRLPIGRMHADEEEEKIQAVRYEEVTIVSISLLCAK